MPHGRSQRGRHTTRKCRAKPGARTQGEARHPKALSMDSFALNSILTTCDGCALITVSWGIFVMVFDAQIDVLDAQIKVSDTKI